MRNLLSAAGAPKIPQFQLILKDRFLRALPSNVASLSGNSSYRNLLELAQCATDAMATNSRYGKQPLPVFTNYRDAQGSSSFGPRQGCFNFLGNRSPKSHQNSRSRETNYTPADRRKGTSSFEPQWPSLVGNPHRDFYSFFNRGINFGFVL